RYYVAGETSPANRNKLIVFLALIMASSIATAAAWGTSEKHWIGYAVTASLWVAFTSCLRFLVPMARKAKLWGVPFVPWLPSASIFINVFLLGSIDRDSFIRFGIWTLVLLIYYVFVGLHATYDTAR
ncbi:hypothetical protein M569_02620, partial [Genlisea aurea]